MSRQFWSETITWATATATAVANTTTETILANNITIPANYMQDGRLIRVVVFGSYGTTGTPTLQLRARWGGVTGTVLAASGAVTTPSAAGGGASMTAEWTMTFYIQTRSNGSGGTLMSNGNLHLFTTGTAGGTDYSFTSGSTGGTTPVAVTADLTADTALSITATWGTANSANSIQVVNYSCEALN